MENTRNWYKKHTVLKYGKILVMAKLIKFGKLKIKIILITLFYPALNLYPIIQREVISAKV